MTRQQCTSPFKQGFGRCDKGTSTLLRSTWAKLGVETAGVATVGVATVVGFGESEAKQAQGHTKGTAIANTWDNLGDQSSDNSIE